MHIKELSLENFRVFKDKQTFNFAPITVFCGANNSGKSSILKSLLLLKSSFEINKLSKLDFKGGNHNLGSFEKTINNRSQKEDITVGLTAGYFLVDHIIINSDPGSTKIKSQPRVTFSRWSSGDQGDEGYLESILAREKEMKLIQTFELSFNKKELVGLKLTNSLGKLIFSSLLNGNKDTGSIKISLDIVILDFFRNELKNYPVIDVESCLVEINELIIFKMENFQSLERKFRGDDFGIIKRDAFIFSYLAYFDCIKYLDLSVYEEEDPFRNYGLSEEQYNESAINGPELQYNGLSGGIIDSINNIIKKYNFSLKLKQNQPKSEFINVNIINKQLHMYHMLEIVLKEIDYLPVLRSTQERLYTFKSQGSVYNQILDEYQVTVLLEDQEWINSKLIDFNIAERVKIRMEPEIGYWVTIHNNGKDYSPIDIGFGFSQLFPILMKIIMNKEGILIIEEPEANLHPNLQSMLANVFVEAFYRFKLQFLIETHSEYFIRKLQHLTATKVIPTNFTAIHYIESNIYADPKSYQIEILNDGGINRTFGEGFFDEAINLQFELLKLKQAQFN